jgi:hypothetical protein
MINSVGTIASAATVYRYMQDIQVVLNVFTKDEFIYYLLGFNNVMTLVVILEKSSVELVSLLFLPDFKVFLNLKALLVRH